MATSNKRKLPEVCQGCVTNDLITYVRKHWLLKQSQTHRRCAYGGEETAVYKTGLCIWTHHTSFCPFLLRRAPAPQSRFRISDFLRWSCTQVSPRHISLPPPHLEIDGGGKALQFCFSILSLPLWNSEKIESSHRKVFVPPVLPTLSLSPNDHYSLYLHRKLRAFIKVHIRRGVGVGRW